MHAPDDFKSILSMHFARYPFMQPQDAVKLAYQSAFGGGHMVTDVQASLRRMREELHACKRGAAYMPLIEPAGNGFCRVNLPALQAHAVSAEPILS